MTASSSTRIDSSALPAPGPAFSVIIPAHNEEAVIGRCLTAMLADAPADAMPEIIVVANGCNDRTVEIARAAAPQAIVLDLAQGSKPAALNAGNQRASVFPRFFVDADIVVNYRALAATADVLRSGRALAAAPAISFDTSALSGVVRAYYRAWQKLPYIRNNLVGSGFFGLSEEGMRRVGTFPPIIADDAFVRSRFLAEERHNVATDAEGNATTFRVFPPHRLATLLHVESRRQAGAIELASLYPPPVPPNATRGKGYWQAMRNHGLSPADLAVFLAVKGLARGMAMWNRLRGRANIWHRDVTSR